MQVCRIISCACFLLNISINSHFLFLSWDLYTADDDSWKVIFSLIKVLMHERRFGVMRNEWHFVVEWVKTVLFTKYISADRNLFIIFDPSLHFLVIPDMVVGSWSVIERCLFLHWWLVLIISTVAIVSTVRALQVSNTCGLHSLVAYRFVARVSWRGVSMSNRFIGLLYFSNWLGSSREFHWGFTCVKFQLFLDVVSLRMDF